MSYAGAVKKSSKTSSVGRTLLRQIWSSDEKERELESRIAMLLAQGEEHVLLKKELPQVTMIFY